MSTRDVNRLLSLVLMMLVGASVGARAQGTGKPDAAKPAPPSAASSAAGPVVVFETEKGIFEFETYPAQAPKTVANIIGLVQKRFYNGLRVHRLEPGFIVQLGDPLTRDMTKKEQWGTGGSGTQVGVAEFSKVLKHAPGMVSMAHRGNPSEADSQFFIVLGPASHLDGRYQIFGKVITGMDVVRKLAVGDRIIRATVKEAK